MKKIISTLLVVLTLLFSNFLTKAQGCSDAGFCTINSFKPHAIDSVVLLKNQFQIGIAYGGADNNINVLGNYLEYNRQLNKNLGLDIKLASLQQSGNDIAKFGLSDLYLNLNHKLSEKIKFIIGTKIPLSNGNAKHKNKALPMDYQASLGTLDLIAGLSFNIYKLQLVAGWQQPLTQNKNTFLAQNYSPTSALAKVQSSNSFQRSGDVLLRFSYPINLSNKLVFSPSLLPIYHLSDDKFVNALNQKVAIIGSKGLTLNANVYFDYQLNKKEAFQINIAAPIVVRDARPDGLTRSLVVGLAYKIKF